MNGQILLLEVHVRVVTPKLICVIECMPFGCVAAGQHPDCQSRVPFWTITWMDALTEPVGAPNLATALMVLFDLLLYFFWA